MIFDAFDLARGWLAVALASSKDGERPALNRTIHIEEHLGGVRLVATDSYVLLHTWVPGIDHDYDAPELDEAPQATATAMDPHGRGKNFLGHALKLARSAAQDDLGPVELRLRLNVAASLDRAGGDRSFPGLEAQSVVVEMPPNDVSAGAEKLTLASYDGAWPAWRRFAAPTEPVETDVIALTPDIIGRLGALGKLYPSARLGWIFGGENKPIRLDVLQSDPHVEGLVMPARWDFDRDAPRVDKPAADGEGEAE